MEHLGNKIRKVSQISKNSLLNDWIDSQDVCGFLRIKPRTLQNLRTNGNLAHTKIGGKIYYRREDARGLIRLISNGNNNNPSTIK